MRPIAERRGLTTLQLACAWNLAHEAVETVVPTLIQEHGGRPVEEQRAELAALPDVRLSADEVAEIREHRRQHRLHDAEGGRRRP